MTVRATKNLALSMRSMKSRNLRVHVHAHVHVHGHEHAHAHAHVHRERKDARQASPYQEVMQDLTRG